MAPPGAPASWTRQLSRQRAPALSRSLHTPAQARARCGLPAAPPLPNRRETLAPTARHPDLKAVGRWWVVRRAGGTGVTVGPGGCARVPRARVLVFHARGSRAALRAARSLLRSHAGLRACVEPGQAARFCAALLPHHHTHMLRSWTTTRGACDGLDRRFDGLIVGPRSPVGSIPTRLRMTAAQGPRLRAGRGRTRRWGPVAYADSAPTGVPTGGVGPPPLTSPFAFVGDREVMLGSSSPCSLHTRGLSFSFLFSHGVTAIGSGFASASSP